MLLSGPFSFKQLIFWANLWLRWTKKKYTSCFYVIFKFVCNKYTIKHEEMYKCNVELRYSKEHSSVRKVVQNSEL